MGVGELAPELLAEEGFDEALVATVMAGLLGAGV